MVPAILLNGVLFMSIVCCTVMLTSCGNQQPAESQSWQEVFNADLSNAIFPAGIWTFEDGVLTASEDQCIWTEKEYDDFVLDIEFRTDVGTNSGVILRNTDIDNWIPGAVEVQIADDHSEPWKSSRPTWQCGAIFWSSCADKKRRQKTRPVESYADHLQRQDHYGGAER